MASSSTGGGGGDADTKARVEEIWKKMNSGMPAKLPTPTMNKLNPAAKQKTKKTTNNWMTVLGLAPNKPSTNQQISENRRGHTQHETSEDAKRLAASALAAARDATAASVRGKVEITEVKDFAGQEIEIKKLVDADSWEAAEKAKAGGAVPTALDSVLEQIRKKPKLSVLDKTKKDWGEFKDDNRGMEEELDAYKKSSNKYLDKVSFLQRADYREFERERDARLSIMAKRKTEAREGDF